MAEIGESVGVLLSTHIVEDVSDLCQAMAIIADGRIVRKGEPHALMAELDGRIWTRTVDKADIPALRESHDLIATRLAGGRTIVHVLSDRDPGEGFTAHRSGLEDVYFASLHAARRAHAAKAA